MRSACTSISSSASTPTRRRCRSCGTAGHSRTSSPRTPTPATCPGCVPRPRAARAAAAPDRPPRPVARSMEHVPRTVHGFNWPDRFVVGTVGEPGSRTFYLQARTGHDLLSVVLEKEQSATLAESIDMLLDELMATEG